VVDAITSGDKTVIYYDSELTGFCLKVLASGGKRWCVEYRNQGKAGTHPSARPVDFRPSAWPQSSLA
jgi:hypothetical protein